MGNVKCHTLYFKTGESLELIITQPEGYQYVHNSVSYFRMLEIPSQWFLLQLFEIKTSGFVTATAEFSFRKVSGLAYDQEITHSSVLSQYWALQIPP